MSYSYSDPPSCCSASAELKLYQAFIFSVPIFFTFILLLLFYLFYLRRRRVDWASLRMRSSMQNDADHASGVCFSFLFFFCSFVLVYNIGVFLNLFGWLENVRKMERSWEFECGVFVWELEERGLFGFFLSPSSDLLLFGFPLSVWLVGECKKWRDWGFESWVFLLFGDSGKCMVGIFFFSLFGWWENLSISMELWTLNLRFFLFSTRHVWWFFSPPCLLAEKIWVNVRSLNIETSRFYMRNLGWYNASWKNLH